MDILKNQECMTQPTLRKLYSNEYGQGLCCYPFTVNLNRCMKSCSTLLMIYPTNCVPEKTEDLNMNVFNRITGTNEPKTLTKHISCNSTCKFSGSKYNLNQKK